MLPNVFCVFVEFFFFFKIMFSKNYFRNTRRVPNGLDPDHVQYFVLFVCFVALRPKSTAMVIAGRSVHLTTPFPGQA